MLGDDVGIFFQKIIDDLQAFGCGASPKQGDDNIIENLFDVVFAVQMFFKRVFELQMQQIKNQVKAYVASEQSLSLSLF